MTHYRCYYLVGDGFRAAETIEASDDATALLSAEKLILKSEFLAVEVWQEKSFIGRILHRAGSQGHRWRKRQGQAMTYQVGDVGHRSKQTS